MYFIIIFGPPAVGKMTVGLEVERLTGIKLFHNHATIEPVLKFFEFGSPPFRRLVDSFRLQMFNEVAGSDLRGLIFTFVWDLDDDFDREFVIESCAPFKSIGAEIALVELSADLDIRLVRNQLPDRLAAKPSKRNIDSSENDLIFLEKNYRLNSSGDNIQVPYTHISIDSSKLSASQTALIIIDKLKLPLASA
ncbi:MAG: hypothetical protein OFPII_04110 [Osedax symbiont Rs1]|nr:MAG: hypothetical protein OFPII_08130 [Osedax symbiont Rs1]EPJ48875.1 MAG: hypothetical protein OFPII_04110 [Osedax symbiont Rs1]